jgi:hypothetical protein
MGRLKQLELHLIGTQPLPSGKLTWLWRITIFNGKIHYKWPFSIANCWHNQRVTTTKSRPSPKASVTSRVARVLGRKWAPPGSESGATRNWNSYNFCGFKASSLILTVFIGHQKNIEKPYPPCGLLSFFLLLCWRVYVCFRMIYTICNNTTVWVSWDQIFLVGHQSVDWGDQFKTTSNFNREPFCKWIYHNVYIYIIYICIYIYILVCIYIYWYVYIYMLIYGVQDCVQRTLSGLCWVAHEVIIERGRKLMNMRACSGRHST